MQVLLWLGGGALLAIVVYGFFAVVRCRHKWVTQVDKFVPSLPERLGGAGEIKARGGALNAHHIVILVCTKCGRVNKTHTIC